MIFDTTRRIGGNQDALVIRGVQSTATLFWEEGLPKKYVVDAPISTIDIKSNSCENIEHIEIKQALSSGLNVSARYGANIEYKLKEIDFCGVPISNFYQAFEYTYTNNTRHLESVYGLNFIKCGGTQYQVGANFTNTNKLKNITLVPNTLGQKDMVATNKNWFQAKHSTLLTDESLVSIANGLCASYTSRVVLASSCVTRCASITGTVTSVTDDTGTYDFFTVDTNGAVTLTEFITITKGWTLTT